ncbi:hypothetical protein JAAARDRAFT_383680 [Jaapia argillacea MUCL 33604]|uniref:Uncharacterized protein n=1 Tax=Jaapia argillacea MUCL 33604 TaxID=933084 RepID=A0A067Q955_9AGAM|nr:hypothetical protein JAAARDRAFT_383680 [Jaapia argillacea MUCL 33604]
MLLMTPRRPSGCFHGCFLGSVIGFRAILAHLFGYSRASVLIMLACQSLIPHHSLYQEGHSLVFAVCILFICPPHPSSNLCRRCQLPRSWYCGVSRATILFSHTYDSSSTLDNLYRTQSHLSPSIHCLYVSASKS